MDRRVFLAGVVVSAFSGCVGTEENKDSTTDDDGGSSVGSEGETGTPTFEDSESTADDDGGGNVGSGGETSTPTFDGWMNPDEMRDGYTVVHISADWEVVPPEETNDWDPDTIQRFRSGACKRYFIYERVPEGYSTFSQGGCEDGVVITVEDTDGRVVSQIELPSKDPNSPVDDPYETPRPSDSTADDENDTRGSGGETGTPTFDGWMNPDEIREGYTVVHISADWEMVPPEETNDWDPDTIQRFRRGACKRYFIYEQVPEDYGIFSQGGCKDGVVITVEDADGQVVSQIELPSKDPDAPVDDPQETPRRNSSSRISLR